jgi:hypothetical protein
MLCTLRTGCIMLCTRVLSGWPRLLGSIKYQVIYEKETYVVHSRGNGILRACEE